MIKTIAAVTTFALSASCTATSHAVTSSWCSTPKPFVREFKELPELRIQQVSDWTVKSAYSMLSGRTLVPLDLATYARMSGDGAETVTGRYLYLMRAGVMAPANLSIPQLRQHAKMASFSAYEGASPESLHIVSLITSKQPQQPKNVPVLVASRTAVTAVSATCIGGR